MSPGEIVGLAIDLTKQAVALSMMPMVVIGGVAVLLWRQRLAALALIVTLMLFPDPSDYGLAATNPFALVYAYGKNTLFFSMFDYALFATWLVCVMFAQRWDRASPTVGAPAAGQGPRIPMMPLHAPYIALTILLAAYLAVGLADPLHDSAEDLGFRGFINLVRAGMVSAIVFAVLRTPRDIEDMAKLMVAALIVRELFGLLRYLLLGGDPQNAYALLQDLPIKITFWDINDSILAGFLAGFAIWKGLAERKIFRWRLIWLAVAALAMATAMLSARRTGQGGMLLAIIGAMLLLPRGRRWPIVLVLCAAIPLALWKTQARSPHADNIVASLILDIKTSPYEDSRLSRFHELRMAWPTMRENIWLGVGPSGSFRITNTRGLEYHNGLFDFVHSGIGHMLLKAGIVGLALFLWLFVAYGWHVLRWWRHLPDGRRPLMAASITGVLAMMPNVFLGTPVIEMRTSMVMGLLLVIPFVLTRGLTMPGRAGMRAAAAAPQRQPRLHEPNAMGR